VNHEQAWARLPDLLDDRDDPTLLAHVRTCADCQRQLFLLGRIDRLLHERAAVQSGERPRRWGARRTLVVVAPIAAAAAVVAALVLPTLGRNEEFMFRTVSGRAAGRVIIGHADARNLSLALIARGLPVDRGQVFVLWAADDTARSPMQVGNFMVDHRGGCRVRFNLPANHSWRQFWITRPGRWHAMIAST
jgi:hypothetical protein